ADDVVYYQPNGNQQGVAAMLQKWRTWNRCPSTGTRVTPYPVNKPNSRSVMEYWGPCDQSAVALLTLDGKGHWHSNDAAGVHTTIELWNFLKKYTLNGEGLPEVSISGPANNSTFTAPANITLTATASDPNGSIAKVEFYYGTTKLGEDATGPYTYTWNNVNEGDYQITAVATDNAGNKATSTAIRIRVNVPQGPYLGTIHTIPGRIEAEHYDVGGEGVAFHESDANGNQGGASLRTDEVDIETTADVSGTHNIAYILQGEWLEYTVDVDYTGNYILELRMAADGAGKTLHVEIDDVNVSGAITVPNTGGWQTWSTVSLDNVRLTQGKHILKIAFDASYMNLNYIDFKEIVTGHAPDPQLLDCSIYPNPSGAAGFNIQSPGLFQYEISDLSGLSVEHGKGTGSHIVGASLVNGAYLLQVSNPNGVSTHKIIKH
ncbi:MAG TPA: carbohydrate-binding protein, partial [Cytophagales bacterium]|nr:carbohydrate-binding protein [Cytophagales bacterium]